MPEGHSVHRLAQQFNDVFAGQKLSVSSPQGKFAAGALVLDQLKLEKARAHGKQLFMEFSQGRILRVHLGLYGAWNFGGDETFNGASSIGAPRRIGEKESAAEVQGVPYSGPPEPQGAVRVRLISEHGWADLRGPTACEVITPGEASVIRAKLGPDPLDDESAEKSGMEFARRIRASGTNIATQLMKQEVIAGVGNVYRAEVLYRAELDPYFSGKSLTQQEALALWADIRMLMADGVRDGRIITTDLIDRPSHLGVEPGLALQAREGLDVRQGQGQVQAPGEDDGGSPRTASTLNRAVPVEDAHYVYKREGLPCRHCGTEIAIAELAARKLYWCPTCQGSVNQTGSVTSLPAG